ncbi:MAG: hypothetical protein ACP5OO_13710 [Chloroflexia bacterium]
MKYLRVVLEMLAGSRFAEGKMAKQRMSFLCSVVRLVSVLAFRHRRSNQATRSAILAAGHNTFYRCYGDSSQIIKIASVLCLGLVFLMSCSWMQGWYIENFIPGNVADELVQAFVTADIERAKAVTVAEQWGKLESEMVGRQPFWCPLNWGWELLPAGGSVGLQITEDEWLYSGSYQCPKEEALYCLEIRDIRIVKTEKGWKVYDWGRICEAHDYEYVCSVMCR